MPQRVDTSIARTGIGKLHDNAAPHSSRHPRMRACCSPPYPAHLSAAGVQVLSWLGLVRSYGDSSGITCVAVYAVSMQAKQVHRSQNERREACIAMMITIIDWLGTSNS